MKLSHRPLASAILGAVLATVLGTSACKTPAPAPTKLTYVEVVTGTTAQDARLPMIIAVHGLGDRPESFVRLFERFDRPARIIAVRGPAPYGPGFQWFATRMADAAPERLAEEMTARARDLDAFARAIIEQRPTRGKPLLTGFSQGAMMSFAVAVQHPNAIRAAFPVGGYVPKSWLSKMPEVPIVAFHGEADTIVPIDSVQAATRAWKKARNPALLRSYAGVRHSITRPMQADLFSALRRHLPEGE